MVLRVWACNHSEQAHDSDVRRRVCTFLYSPVMILIVLIMIT